MSLTPRQKLAHILRKMHLLPLADFIWFLRDYWMNRESNARFIKKHPDVNVPPPMMLYDIQGNCDYSGFYSSGRSHAHEISRIISSVRPGKTLKILEWGCGPARVIRHMGSLDDSDWELWGSDYNRQTISWCQQHFSNIHFLHNNLEPPLPAENELFDVIYCISVFTHLSEERHYQWVSEIIRLLRPGGLFIGTFHGEHYRVDLTEEEKRKFDSGELVVRDKIIEGKKNFGAFHSDSFVSRLFSSFISVRKLDDSHGFRQTVWVAVK